jgi:cation-transporting ATPase E
VAEQSTIFGRVTPQLVQALRSCDHYVAMIGDGVNDILSLKQAILGVAMQSGSQASLGVADMVLLKDSFAALPQVFSEGQRISSGMHNILKLFLTRIFYATVFLVGTMVLGGFPFEPKQNAILTLLTEGIPALALAIWARPGPSTGRFLARSFFHFVIPAGVTLGLAGLGVYVAELVFTANC